MKIKNNETIKQWRKCNSQKPEDAIKNRQFRDTGNFRAHMGQNKDKNRKLKKLPTQIRPKSQGVNTTVREEYTAPVSCKKPFMFSIGTSFKIFK
jgi:hypothetical protein